MSVFVLPKYMARRKHFVEGTVGDKPRQARLALEGGGGQTEGLI